MKRTIVVIVALTAYCLCRGPDKPAAERPAIRSARIELPRRVAAQLRQPAARSPYVVRGVVESGDGVAIAGARVAARGLDRTEIAATITDDDGHYALGVRAGSTIVEADAPGFAQETDFIDVTGVHDKRFQLVAGAALRGRVVREDGAPCSDAKVLIEIATAGGMRQQTRYAAADANGAFAIASLPPGDVDISAHGVGCVTARPTQVVLALGQSMDATVRAERGYAISGIVVDARTKQPVAGAQVQGRWQERPRDRAARADTNGRFEIHGFRAESTEVKATLGDLEGSALAEIVDRDVDVRIELAAPEPVAEVAEPPRPPRDVLLDVIEPTGAPVAWTRVVLALETGESREAVTDAEGQVKLARFPRGVKVDVRVEGRRAIDNSDSQEITFFSPYDRILVRPLDDAPAPPIRGRVIDPDGRPLASIYISVGTPGAPARETVSRSDGSFEVESAWNATHEVIATAADARLTATVTAKPGEPVTIQLARRFHVDVRVTRDGRPVENFRPYCKSGDGWLIGTTLHAGRLRDVEAGTLFCVVYADEGSGSGTIVVAHGAPNVVAIALAPNATITGRMLAHGKPLAKTQLAVSGPHGRYDVFAETDDQGRFVITNVAAGETEIQIDGETVKKLATTPGARVDVGDVPVP